MPVTIPVTYGRIFRLWVPLAATWLMMSAEGPFLAAVIARLNEPTFNLAAYATLTQMIAQECGLGLGRFAHTIVDAHIYAAEPGTDTAEYDHVAGLRRQLERQPRPLPRLVIARKPFDELSFDDFDLLGYECDEAIRFKVAV